MHEPVLLAEVITNLNLTPGMKVIDATLGGGSHTLVMAQKVGPTGHILGLDADLSTVEATRERLSSQGNVKLVTAWFDQLAAVAESEGFTAVDGILFDLGMSSLQLDDPARGFSFQASGPLDMRFDPSQRLTAAEIVNRWQEKQLADTF